MTTIYLVNEKPGGWGRWRNIGINRWVESGDFATNFVDRDEALRKASECGGHVVEFAMSGANAMPRRDAAPADTPAVDLTAKYAAWESGEPTPDTPAMVEARRLIAEGWDPVDDDSVRNRIDSSRRMPVGRAVVGAMGTLMVGGGK